MQVKEMQPAIEPLPKQMGLNAGVKTSLAVGVATLTAAFPAGAVGLAASGAFVDAIIDSIRKIGSQRTEELLTAVASEGKFSLEDAANQLIAREDIVILVAEALDAARRSRLQGKASALGRSLGQLLTDDAVVDLESIWLRILAIVEPPHIRILKLFLEQTGVTGLGSTLWGVGKILRVSEVGETLGVNEAVLPLVQDLLRAGLLMDPGPEGPGSESGLFEVSDTFSQSLKATTLGAQLFARLSLAGSNAV